MAKVCQRCGIPENETELGVLAYNSGRLVCSECDSDLNNEWVNEEPGRVHPLDTLNPVAHLLARLAS